MIGHICVYYFNLSSGGPRPKEQINREVSVLGVAREGVIVQQTLALSRSTHIDADIAAI